MKVIKNINNNVSLCKDSKGREVIAFGKGIGFIKINEEVPLNKINRTFYNVKDTDLSLVNHIPTPIMEASIRIIDEVENKLNVTLMSTAALSLADHINFAIQRLNKHIYLAMSVQEDLKYSYPNEMKLAYKAIEIIKEETDVQLPRNEAGAIALHFINNKMVKNETDKLDTEKFLDKIVSIIEKFNDIHINKDSFNYSRFVTHIIYLMQRTLEGTQIESDNKHLLISTKKEYPNNYKCAEEINKIFIEELNRDLNQEEQLYLVLHINRLCSREKQN